MKKQTGKERVKKEWCYGIDLRILVALSLEDECWEFIHRITEDNIGDCYLISNMGRVYDCDKQTCFGSSELFLINSSLHGSLGDFFEGATSKFNNENIGGFRWKLKHSKVSVI